MLQLYTLVNIYSLLCIISLQDKSISILRSVGKMNSFTQTGDGKQYNFTIPFLYKQHSFTLPSLGKQEKV